MPRQIRSAELENRTARLKLNIQRKPYFARVAPGLSLGYRRNHTAGAWLVRGTIAGTGKSWTRGFAAADDHQQANGTTVLTFKQALVEALKVAKGPDGGDAPATVDAALTRYADDLRGRGGNPYNAQLARNHVAPALLAKLVQFVTADDLRAHRDRLVAEGLAPSSVNRICTPLKAALELARTLDPARIKNQEAWEVGLKKLSDATVARHIVFEEAEVRALVTAAHTQPGTFGLFVELGAVTGSRPSQIRRLLVRDLKAGYVNMPTSRKGNGQKKIKHQQVPIPPGLAAALRVAAGKRGADARLLLRPDGKAWNVGNHKAPFAEALAAAGVERPGATFYSLRHSSVTRQLLANTPIRLVAQLHDTSVAEIERCYSESIGERGADKFRAGQIDLSPTVVPIAA